MTRVTSHHGYATRLLPVLALLLSLFLPSESPAFIRQNLPDPVFFPDADVEICRNDPVDNIDPLGMDPFAYVKLGVITPEQKARYFKRDGKYYTWAGGGAMQFLSEVGEFEGYYGLSPSVAALYAGQVAPQDQPYSTVSGGGFGSRGQFGTSVEAQMGPSVGDAYSQFVSVGAGAVMVAVAPINHAYQNYQFYGGNLYHTANATINPAFYLMAHGNALFTGTGVEWYNSGEHLNSFSRGVNGAFMVVDAAALYAGVEVGAAKSYAGLRGWTLRGVEHDEFYWTLTPEQQALYLRGQKTFSPWFWQRNAAKLESFTAGKSGAEYVQGVVERGKWLQETYPWYSSDYNVLDTLLGAPYTVGTGPTPELRRQLLRILEMER